MATPDGLQRQAQRRSWLRAARKSAHLALEPAGNGGRLSWLNVAICSAIVSSVALAIAETEPTIAVGRTMLFHRIEVCFALVFAGEYALRVWAAPERAPSRRRPWRARLGWMLSPPALVDLAAFLPPLLLLAGAPTFVLRLIRLLRIIRLANLGPISSALDLVLRTVVARRHELAAAVAVGGVVLILAATLLYMLEGDLQPRAFGSVPRALWWGVITLTTVGYGDVHPITPLGKLVAAATAFVGIALVAAPAGVLAAGFTEALRARERKDTRNND